MDSDREEFISKLDEYIESSKHRLQTVLSALGWTEEDTVNGNTCSRDLPKEQENDKDDPLLPMSFDCKHSIVINEDQLKEILNTSNVSIPKKFSDIQLNYTREQKRELYDYVIYNTRKTPEPELNVSISNDNQGSNDIAFAEIVEKVRKKNIKLKRKYRTSKPTHIEKVRNLVHLQMQALYQYLNPKFSELETSGYQRYREYRDVNAPELRAPKPRAPEPRALELRAPGPRTTGPRTPEPRAPEPRASGARTPEQRAPGPRGRERGRSVHVHRESRSRDRINRSIELESWNRNMVYQSGDRRSITRSRSTERKRQSIPRSKTRTQSRSPVRSSSSSRIQSISHSKKKYKRSSRKKTKKRSKSHSKFHGKSHKHKKNKHKSRKIEKHW